MVQQNALEIGKWLIFLMTNLYRQYFFDHLKWKSSFADLILVDQYRASLPYQFENVPKSSLRYGFNQYS